MLEDQSLSMLSCVVVDELHMVGDQDRGYQLELLLTKLRYAAAACEGDPAGGGDEYPPEDCLAEGLQVVGMSATLPNVDVVARWTGWEGGGARGRRAGGGLSARSIYRLAPPWPASQHLRLEAHGEAPQPRTTSAPAGG